MSMIVKGIRLRSKSSIARTIRHLSNGSENDAVTFVTGTPADIHDMHSDAVTAGSKYAVRHWIIAPYEKMSRNQLAEVISGLSTEFAFDPSRAVVVEHVKKRTSVEATDVHWHIIVGEVDPGTNRILSSSFDRIRHELIARIAEFSFGHAFNPGKHSKAVIRGMRQRNLHCIADALEHFLDSSAPAKTEAFTHARHQQVKRHGFDLPALTQEIKSAMSLATSSADLTGKLSALGLNLTRGDKPGVWLVFAGDLLLGALHRLAGLQKANVDNFMKKAKPIEPAQIKVPDDTLLNRDTAPVVDRPAVPGQIPEIRNLVQQMTHQFSLMEQSALSELKRTILDFHPTTGMRHATKACRDAQKALSEKVARRSELHRQISAVPPIGWWSRLTGSAGQRRQKIAELDAILGRVDAEVRRKEVAIAVCRRKEVYEEKAAKDSHVTIVRDISERQNEARTMLLALGHARTVLTETPDVALKGPEFVLSLAKSRLHRSELLAEHMTDSAGMEMKS